jgi:hypothetical protein
MWILAVRVSAAVLEAIVLILVGLFGGQYVGGRLGSPEVGMYCGGGLGVLAASMTMRRLAKQVNREDTP